MYGKIMWFRFQIFFFRSPRRLVSLMCRGEFMTLRFDYSPSKFEALHSTLLSQSVFILFQISTANKALLLSSHLFVHCSPSQLTSEMQVRCCPSLAHIVSSRIMTCEVWELFVPPLLSSSSVRGLFVMLQDLGNICFLLSRSLGFGMKL